VKPPVLLAVVLALAVGSAGAAGMPGRQQPVFRTGVDLVRLDVQVTAGDNPIAGLGVNDFHVADNGVPQRLSMATTEGDLAVVLVLDTSGSVTGGTLKQLVSASQSLVAMLEPGDIVSLVTVAGGLSLEAGSVRDPRVISRALLDARPAGRTALWDAILAGASLVAGHTGRSLVLVFTDGTDTSSWITLEQLREALKRSEAVVYAVLAGDWSVPEGNQWKARGDLKSLVSQTGGALIPAESGQRLPQQFKGALDSFRTRYLLAYEPTGVRRDDGWHRVDVRVKGRKAKVVVRPGYYAPGPRVPSTRSRHFFFSDRNAFFAASRPFFCAYR